MTYAIKSKKSKEKETFAVEKREIPYQDAVSSYANPDTKEIMWIKTENIGKGWEAIYVNGKLVKKSRSGTFLGSYVPKGFKKVSLFSEMSYHSALTQGKKGKITRYGTHDYNLDYSDFKPIGKYKLLSPLKTNSKKEFAEVKNEVELQKWNYIVLNWKPEENTTKLQIEHKIKTPYGEDKEIYKSRVYDISEKNQAVKDFRNYVAKVKNKEF
jgi:hypothetical protein